MEQHRDGAGADTPAQDAALRALAALLEHLGDEAVEASAAADDVAFADCTARAEVVVRCIVGLPALTLRGASAKASAVRAQHATSLLPRELVDALASNMHADVTRLRASMEGQDMRDLRPSFRAAQASLHSAREDLRLAAAGHAGHDPSATLHLGQLAAGVDRALAGLPRDLETPSAPDPAVVAAGGLHEAVATAFDAVLGVWEAAEAVRTVVEVSGAALVRPEDLVLFGIGPKSDAFDGWTAPTDGARLDDLALPLGSAAWRRREAIRSACARWCERHQAAVDAAGVVALRDCLAGLHGTLVEIRTAIVGTPASTVAAARAKARVAARSLVELGDDPKALSAIAREFGDMQDACPSSRLAWAAVGDLLASEARR